jgi:hypothetical protein
MPLRCPKCRADLPGSKSGNAKLSCIKCGAALRVEWQAGIFFPLVIAWQATETGLLWGVDDVRLRITGMLAVAVVFIPIIQSSCQVVSPAQEPGAADASPVAFFILQSNGDIGMYSSISEAESSMESPDIEAGEYVRAFDENGNVYSIGTLGTQRIGLSRRVLDIMPGILKPTGEEAKAELRELLRSRLPESNGVNASLESLVAAAGAYLAESSKRKWFGKNFFLPPPRASSK